MHAGHRIGEMVGYLVGEITGGHRDVVHAYGSQGLDIVVNYGLPLDFEQWLGGVEGQRAQTFAFSTGH